MKKDYTGIILIVILCFTVLGFYVGLKCSQVARQYPEPFEIPLPSLIDIQRRVGAKPDGVYGDETKFKWETAYANQESAKFMTQNGKPRKK